MNLSADLEIRQGSLIRISQPNQIIALGNVKIINNPDYSISVDNQCVTSILNLSPNKADMYRFGVKALVYKYIFKNASNFSQSFNQYGEYQIRISFYVLYGQTRHFDFNITVMKGNFFQIFLSKRVLFIHK